MRQLGADNSSWLCLYSSEVPPPCARRPDGALNPWKSVEIRVP